jgi:diacylglycerol kinase (ATP)
MASQHSSRQETQNPSCPPEATYGASQQERRRIVVILNPRAGRGQGAARRAELEGLMATAAGECGAEWRIVETRAAGDGANLARQAVREGATVVAAAGGDGTLNEVMNGLMGAENGPENGAVTGPAVACGLIPLGTGNDFARCIGTGVDLKRAVDTLFHDAPRPVDVGRAGERWFLNIAGCGFDALVADRINRGFRYLHGTTAYIAAVCDCLRTLKAARLTLTLADPAPGESQDQGKPPTQRIETRALMCSVANATSYGGGMKITPDARIDDGLFDICLLREAGRLEFLLAFPRVFKGTHITHPKVTMLRAAEVRVESDPPLPILVDGDVIGVTPITFTLHRHLLQMLMPVVTGANPQQDKR